MAHFHGLVEDNITITSGTTSVDYNDNYDHEDDDTMPSLLVFEPQDFSRPLSNAIVVFGDYKKTKSGCSWDVAIFATGFHSVCTTIA